MKRVRPPVIGAALVALLLLTIVAPASGRPGITPRAPRTGAWDGAARHAKPLPAVVPVRDVLTRALERGAIDEATYALERARAVFDIGAVRARYGAVRPADPRGATMVLRDLVLRLEDLSPAQLEAARAILARPTDGAADQFEDGYTVAEASPVCSTNGCVHYVTSTEDAPALTDTTPANGIPDYVDSTRDTFEEVWATEVTTYGYRPPKSDETSTNNGGSALIAGVYTNNLANNEDHVVLRGPLLEPILDFIYDDDWYPITDGLGFSLAVVDEGAPVPPFTTHMFLPRGSYCASIWIR